MTVDTYIRSIPHDKLSPQALLSLPILCGHDCSYVQSYLQRIDVDESVAVFAAGLSRAVNHQALAFLNQLNKKLHSEFRQIHRKPGPPQTQAFALQTRHGACRDLALLFIDCCRVKGIAV